MTKLYEEIRSKQREQWTVASKGWITHREEVSDPSKPITDSIVKLSVPTLGQRVLDLACGVGDPALTLADIVGPAGFVLGLDIAQAMVEGARSFAKQDDVQNVKFETIDNELELGVTDESFDLCTCRHGLMFMPNPQNVMKAMSATVKPGGRITISTWGLQQNSPAFTVPGQVIGRYASLPSPDPKEPGLFSLSTQEIHTRLFEEIGFQNIEIDQFDCPVMIAENPEAMWDLVSTIGGPIAKVIRDLETDTRAAVHKDFVQTLSNMFLNRVILTGEVLVTTGIKPLS